MYRELHLPGHQQIRGKAMEKQGWWDKGSSRSWNNERALQWKRKGWHHSFTAYQKPVSEGNKLRFTLTRNNSKGRMAGMMARRMEDGGNDGKENGGWRGRRECHGTRRRTRGKQRWRRHEMIRWWEQFFIARETRYLNTYVKICFWQKEQGYL